MSSFVATSNQNRGDDRQNRLFTAAEKEMSSFVSAVESMFGTEQARQAANDWITELESYAPDPKNGVNPWREVSIAAASRLAERVCLIRRTIETVSGHHN